MTPKQISDEMLAAMGRATPPTPEECERWGIPYLDPWGVQRGWPQRKLLGGCLVITKELIERLKGRREGES